MSKENKYVYLLWDHGEHGPESIVAADSPAALMKVAGQVCAKDDMDDLVKLLKMKPEWLADTPMTEHNPRSFHLGPPGWGGAHLQVLKMETA